MTLEIEIRLKCGGDTETILAHEQAHLSGITDTQRHEARRVAKAALDLVTGDKVLGRPLSEHLSAAD